MAHIGQLVVVNDENSKVIGAGRCPNDIQVIHLTFFTKSGGPNSCRKEFFCTQGVRYGFLVDKSSSNPFGNKVE